MSPIGGVILVPVNFSPECALVLRAAEDKAIQDNCALLLGNVIGMGSPLRQRAPFIETDPLQESNHLN